MAQRARTEPMKYFLIFLIVLSASLLLPANCWANNTYTAELDGDAAYFSIPSANQTGLGITGDFSIVGWVYMHSYHTSVEYERIFGKFGSVGNYGYTLYFFKSSNQASNEIGVELSLTGSDYKQCKFEDQGNADILLPTNSWIHIACSWTSGPSSDCACYLNGSIIPSQQKVYSIPIAAVYDNTADATVGAVFLNAPTPAIDGLIDEVYVYNRVLTDQEIADNYAGTACASDYVAYWKFDNSVLDESTNNNDWTNNNSATFQDNELPFEENCGGEEEPPTPPALTSPVSISPYMIASDDLTIIAQTTEIYNASGTLIGVNHSWYHIPFLLWAVIFSIMAIVFGRMMIEMVIRLRK